MNDEPRSSSLDIAVSIHDAVWLEVITDLEDRSRAVVRKSLEFLGQRDAEGGRILALAGAPLEVSLVFTDDAEQRSLNRDYRRTDGATNVLSFPNMDDDPGVPAGGFPRLLGDVVLARETIVREADAQAKSVSDHTAHLLVHGLLHLLGYDHQDPNDAEVMETLETEILAALGIADPYTPVAAGAAHV